MSFGKAREIKNHIAFNMALWIDDLAREAADPSEAGRKMRQCFYTLGKLTNRQLTVDLLRKLCERRVGTHEVESTARRVIKGQVRRNLEVVEFLLKIKLRDALRWTAQLTKQFLREKDNLYMSINRGGLIKQEFWTKAKFEVN